ncbi:hypothetical protein D5272_17360 [bacterium D16-76]|nr:hypothetical protein [bacterium D16-76]
MGTGPAKRSSFLSGGAEAFFGWVGPDGNGAVTRRHKEGSFLPNLGGTAWLYASPQGTVGRGFFVPPATGLK